MMKSTKTVVVLEAFKLFDHLSNRTRSCNKEYLKASRNIHLFGAESLPVALVEVLVDINNTLGCERMTVELFRGRHYAHLVLHFADKSAMVVALKYTDVDIKKFVLMTLLTSVWQKEEWHWYESLT